MSDELLQALRELREAVRRYDDPRLNAAKFSADRAMARAYDAKNGAIHHLDGDPHNNDLGNLELRRRRHCDGEFCPGHP